MWDVNGSCAKIPADSQLQLSDEVSACEVAANWRSGYRNPHKRDFKFTNLDALVPRVMCIKLLESSITRLNFTAAASFVHVVYNCEYQCRGGAGL